MIAAILAPRGDWVDLDCRFAYWGRILNTWVMSVSDDFDPSSLLDQTCFLFLFFVFPPPFFPRRSWAAMLVARPTKARHDKFGFSRLA